MSQVIISKSGQSLFKGPGRSADMLTDFGVGLHTDKGRLVVRFVGTKNEPVGFKKDHRERASAVLISGGFVCRS